MIHPEILAGWSRLSEHPELMAAVEHEQTVSETAAAAAALRALAGGGSVASAIRELVALDAAASARALLDAAPAPAEGEEPQPGQLSDVDRQALSIEIDDAGSHARAELHLARARLEARARTCRVSLAVPWPHHDAPLDVARLDIEHGEAAAAREIDERIESLTEEMTAAATDQSWSTERIAAVRGLLRERRLRDAEQLIRVPEDPASCWPGVAGERPCLPAQVAPLAPWPWPASLEDVLGWLGRGAQGRPPPPGFAAAFSERPVGRSADIIDALQRASGASETPQALEALLQAAAVALDARIADDDGEYVRALVLDDALLGVVPAFGRMTVSPATSTGHVLALRTGGGSAELRLTDADLLAAVEGRALHRPRLLRVLGAQLDLQLDPLGVAPGGEVELELMLAWGLWLIGVDPDEQAVALACVLAADRPDLATRLLNATLAQHQRGSRLAAAAVGAEWQSPGFDDVLRDWLDEILTSPSARWLLEGIVELDEDEVPLDLLVDETPGQASDSPGGAAARALAAAGLVEPAADGVLRCPAPTRAVLRRALKA